MIDFRNVRTFGSSAFGVLAAFVRPFLSVKVCNISHNLRLGAALVGLDDWVEFAESRESAIAAAIDDAQRGCGDTEDYPVLAD